MYLVSRKWKFLQAGCRESGVSSRQDVANLLPKIGCSIRMHKRVLSRKSLPYLYNVSARSLSGIIALTKDRRRKLTLKSKCIARIVTRYCQKQEYVSKNDDILLERQIKTKHAMMKLEKR